MVVLLLVLTTTKHGLPSEMAGSPLHRHTKAQGGGGGRVAKLKSVPWPKRPWGWRNQRDLSEAPRRVPLTDGMSKARRTCGLCKGSGTIGHPGLCIPFTMNGCEIFFSVPNYCK